MSNPPSQGGVPPSPDERIDIRKLGHREFVGGLWDEIGQLQFGFMVDHGLGPEHVFLDVACGSLRGGRHFICYLEPGHCLGIDKSEELVRSGLEEEVGEQLVAERAPEIVISDRFEFSRLSKRPDFALAQSLFTHLTVSDIRRCLSNLRRFADDCRFYATFFEVAEPVENEHRSHSRLMFYYTAEEMARMGAEAGWEAQYIGDWNHPRDQKMILYVPKGLSSI